MEAGASGSYNAKSGVGIIIDKETGKILYMGVRNKYCADCCKENIMVIAQNILVFRSSSAMETDTIVDGFRKTTWITIH